MCIRDSPRRFHFGKIEELEHFDLRGDVTLWQEVAQLFEQLEERRAP